MNLGNCYDCGDPVDIVVVRDQFINNDETPFICVNCKCVRITEKAKAACNGLQAKAKETRESASQLSLMDGEE